MTLAMAPALKTGPDSEHPVVAWIGLLAMLIAIVLIVWARFEVHGTEDLAAALSDEPARPAQAAAQASPDADRQRLEDQLDEAIAAGRFAGGFSP